MNSKILILITLFSLISCGVKKAPTAAPDRVVESYIQEFTDESPGQAPEQIPNQKKK